MKRDLKNHKSKKCGFGNGRAGPLANHSIDKILDALKDGRWHTMQDVISATKIEESKTKVITSFLQKHQFVQVDRKERIKLTGPTKKLLDKIPPAPSCENITA